MPTLSTAAPARAPLKSWELLREVGRGAHTIVHQAQASRGPTGSGDYAVKMLRPEFQHDTLAKSLLQREAFVARQVRHPHLVTVLAFDGDATPNYLVTPFYAGVTIARLLERQDRIATPQALWIVRQIAEAVAALHDGGWLHLDLQPANMIVAPTGHVTVLDLGLAQRLEDASAQNSAREALVGTPSHMPPEMFTANAPLTGTADVYSLGVLLYQLLVGSLPFADDDPMELAAAHLETPPPQLRERLPHISSRVARLVRQMLSKQPLRRPGIQELVARLAELEIETFAERG